jgi:hypothetical protein
MQKNKTKQNRKPFFGHSGCFFVIVYMDSFCNLTVNSLRMGPEFYTLVPSVPNTPFPRHWICKDVCHTGIKAVVAPGDHFYYHVHQRQATEDSARANYPAVYQPFVS